MKTSTNIGLIALLLSTAIGAQNYSSYRYIASKRMNACFPANNFQGKDVSPNRLISRYPCEVVNKSDSLGGILVRCTESPLAQQVGIFLFIKNPGDCDSALEALRQM